MKSNNRISLVSRHFLHPNSAIPVHRANQAYRTVSQEKASQVQDELESRMSEASAPSIFVSNLAVSWFLAVPP